MAWKDAVTGEPWGGRVHEFLGVTYTGKTRTVSSRRLEYVEEPELPPLPSEVKKKKVVRKRGSTAWD